MRTPEAKRVPGEEGIWVLIGGELFAFSIFFLIFVYYRGQQPEIFARSHATLNGAIGLANTLVLLTSSLFVAMGVRRVRENLAGAGRLFGLALTCGGLFIALKVVEYGEKIRHGITPLTNDFYTYYFAFTGIHLTHVLLGSAALLVMIGTAKKPASGRRTMIVECGAIFWHLVDLLWIMLFALFYLAGGTLGQG
ncbi:MAG: cytochrome c oxidase subunit 3 [Sphingobium sp.]